MFKDYKYKSLVFYCNLMTYTNTIKQQYTCTF